MCIQVKKQQNWTWKTQQWPQDWKGSVFISIPKKGNAKECSNYHTVALISHASKVMLKILQARLQQYMNFQMCKLDLEKAEEPEIKLPTSAGSYKKQENSRKTSISHEGSALAAYGDVVVVTVQYRLGFLGFFR